MNDKYIQTEKERGTDRKNSGMKTEFRSVVYDRPAVKSGNFPGAGPMIANFRPKSDDFTTPDLVFEALPRKVFAPEPAKFHEIMFKSKRRRIYSNINDYILKPGDLVIVDAENGFDSGVVCAAPNCDKHAQKIGATRGETPAIVRKANAEDLIKLEQNRKDELAIEKRAKELVVRFRLEMKVTEAEWQFDRQRLTISFTAPTRIDFRELVKELARSFRTRIELRQISTREEAKQIGGLGSCGRAICCSSFPSDCAHVTLEHARLQQLSNNVAKLSGYCGRLKCCLLYEHDNYVEEMKKYPPLNSIVDLPDGKAKIIKIDIFKRKALAIVAPGNMFVDLTIDEMTALAEKGKIKAPPREEIPASLLHSDVDPETLGDFDCGGGY